jgi:hypothetical protein
MMPKIRQIDPPSFLVGDELLWGNDRLEEALRWAGDGQK